MDIKKFALTYFLFINVIISLAGDTHPEKPDNKVIRKADNLFIFCDYRNALPIYEKLNKSEPENALYNFRLGVCYYYSGSDVLKCLPYFEKAKKNLPEGTEDAVDLYYYLGTSYHMINRFDDAIECYSKLKTFILPDKQGTEDIKDLDEQIAACNRGKELILHPVRVQLINLGPNVNSEYGDYAPVISHDQSMLMFTSKRKECTGGRIDEDGNYYEDVFISRKTGDDEWQASEKLDTAENLKHNIFPFRFSKSKAMGNSINTKEHDASVALSPDGKQLYIYRLDDVWVSDYKNNKWNKPSRLNNFINSKKSHEPSVSLTMDEKTLYFVSEREGGYGGKDIYRSEKQSDGSWGEPSNLGPEINSEYDEDAPFIDAENNTLYFSSEAHGSMGGFDIFKARLENGNWSQPENLGYPINSGANDVFYVYNSKEKTAYFSSIREGGLGNYDIYMLDFKPKKDRYIKTIFTVTLNGKLKNEPTLIELSNPDKGKDSLKLSNQPYDGAIYQPGRHYSMTITTPSGEKYPAEFTISENASSEHSFQEIAFEETKDENGNVTGYRTSLYNAFFDVDSAMKNTPFEKRADKTQAIADYIASLKKSNDPSLNVLSFDEKIKVDENSPINKRLLNPLLFDYAKARISGNDSELKATYEYLKKNKSATLLITGYTDSKGDEVFNQRLSEKRASTVRNYFIMQGINSRRVQFKGNGENTPVAPNTNDDGTDNPEGRKLNRRAELQLFESGFPANNKK